MIDPFRRDLGHCMYLSGLFFTYSDRLAMHREALWKPSFDYHVAQPRDSLATATARHCR